MDIDLESVSKSICLFYIPPEFSGVWVHYPNFYGTMPCLHTPWNHLLIGEWVSSKASEIQNKIKHWMWDPQWLMTLKTSLVNDILVWIHRNYGHLLLRHSLCLMMCPCYFIQWWMLTPVTRRYWILATPKIPMREVRMGRWCSGSREFL